VEWSKGIHLSQVHLANQIVDEAEGYLGKNILRVRLPLLDGKLVTLSNEPPVERTQYQHFIGCLNYLALGTQPDLLYTINYLARYSQNYPQRSHWRALTHLIGDLKSSINEKLLINPCDAKLQLWVDSGWGGEFAQSTSGFFVRIGGAVVAWGSR
jgi:hypothetical protein